MNISTKKILICWLIALVVSSSFETASARIKVRKQKNKSPFSPSTKEFIGSKKVFRGAAKQFEFSKDEFLSSYSDFKISASEFEPSRNQLIDPKYKAVVVETKYIIFGRRRASSGKFSLSEPVCSSGGFGLRTDDFSPSTREFKSSKIKTRSR